MVQWIAPLVIGIYVGILVDPWLRAWITQNHWARQDRKLDVRKPTEGDGDSADLDLPTGETSDLSARMGGQEHVS
jgi:hypothetical protein